MGRTKRLRRRKRTDVTTTNNIPCNAIPLYNYLGQFGWRNHSKLLCKSFGTAGRGLCSKTGITAGDVLIRLPLKAMITIATLENDYKFRDYFKMSTEAVSFQSLLALYILYLKHNVDYKQSLKLYIDSIPKIFSTPYFCKSDELYFLPEAILQQTVEQNKKIRGSYCVFQNIFANTICNCCGQSYMLDIFTLDAFKWAYFAVNSRSVFLNPSKIKSLISSKPFFKQMLNDEPNMALAPLLDMFNHSDKASIDPQIVYESSDFSFQLITNESYKAYKEIFISYGCLANLNLLTNYGFSLDRNVNDYFEISLEDIESFMRSERTFKGMFFHSNKFKFIRDHSLNDQMFIHAVDGLSHNLQITLHLVFKETSHFTNVLSQTAFGSNTFLGDCIRNEANLLILYKITEYQSFIDCFLKLKVLSLSAQATVQYLSHSIKYLQSYLNKCS